ASLPSTLMQNLGNESIPERCQTPLTWSASAPTPQAQIDVEGLFTDPMGESLLLRIDHLAAGLTPRFDGGDACGLLGPLHLQAGACLPTRLDVTALELRLLRATPNDAWNVGCGRFVANGGVQVTHDDCDSCGAGAALCHQVEAAEGEPRDDHTWSPP